MVERGHETALRISPYLLPVENAPIFPLNIHPQVPRVSGQGQQYRSSTEKGAEVPLTRDYRRRGRCRSSGSSSSPPFHSTLLRGAAVAAWTGHQGGHTQQKQKVVEIDATLQHLVFNSSGNFASCRNANSHHLSNDRLHTKNTPDWCNKQAHKYGFTSGRLARHAGRFGAALREPSPKCCLASAPQTQLAGLGWLKYFANVQPRNPALAPASRPPII